MTQIILFINIECKGFVYLRFELGQNEGVVPFTWVKFIEFGNSQLQSVT